MLSALSVAEKFSVGGITALLGLGMTFLVLGLLIGCVYLVNILLKVLIKFIEKQKEAIKSKKTDSAQIEMVEAPVKKSVEVCNAIDEETMVAIRSAVEIYLRENGGENGEPHENVTIKSVTKI